MKTDASGLDLIHTMIERQYDVRWSGKTAPVTDDGLQHLGIFGSPAEVATRIVQRLRDATLRPLCFFANPPGMAPEVASARLQLCATEVRARVTASFLTDRCWG